VIHYLPSAVGNYSASPEISFHKTTSS